MGSDFVLFSPPHGLILSLIASLGVACALLVRRYPAAARPMRLALGSFLLVNELVWYTYRLSTEGFRFPEGLPLQLCDVALWMTVVAAVTMRHLPLEIAYFAGLGGTSLAIITPDLWAPLASYPSIYYFLAHGGVVVTLVFLVGGGLLQPRPDCLWRVVLILNGYALSVGIFNAVYGTNYFFLCRKPASATLLDYMGPWPYYILTGEVIAIALFWLLALPFRRRGRSAH